MTTVAIGKARFDPAFGARVIGRRPLLYRRGADPTLDRPAHVRAGSALVAIARELAVIQDDASFLAIVDPATGLARDIPFPGGDVRQFDELRGNKKDKLDLEAGFLDPRGNTLVLLGSGSSPKRERIVLVDDFRSDAPRVTIVHAAELYAALREDRSLAGTELNIEGAAALHDDLVLLQRGNGAPIVTEGLEQRPVDATCRIGLSSLLAYLEGAAPAPPIRSVMQWELGSSPRRLTFTDGATHSSGAVGFLACAEDSPDATRDGPVTAVAIGLLDESARTASIGLILDERGAPLLDKAEGLAFNGEDHKRAFVVTDRDDPNAPSELLELELGSAWS